jgi:hypothetical protein
MELQPRLFRRLGQCPELEPEIWALADRIPESVAELVAATRQHRAERARHDLSQ